MKHIGTLNAALICVLLGLWAAIVLLRPDYSKRNFRWIPQMEDSLALEAQRGFLPTGDKRVAGAPVPGTIARGYPPMGYTATAEDAARAGRELKNPAASTAEALARGGQVFATYCFPCHGAGGMGDGPVAKHGVPAPPSLLGDKTIALPDGRMFHIVTYGQGNMPSYASQIEREDRWKAVLYVRSLQAAAKSKEKTP